MLFFSEKKVNINWHHLFLLQNKLKRFFFSNYKKNCGTIGHAPFDFLWEGAIVIALWKKSGGQKKIWSSYKSQPPPPPKIKLFVPYWHISKDGIFTERSVFFFSIILRFWLLEIIFQGVKTQRKTSGLKIGSEQTKFNENYRKETDEIAKSKSVPHCDYHTVKYCESTLFVDPNFRGLPKSCWFVGLWISGFILAFI